MATSNRSMHTPDIARRVTALGLALFLLISNIAYALLIRDFGYDDILRQPAAEVLALFEQQRDALILEWLGFALAALLFLPIAWALPAQLGARGSLFALCGALSALLQTSALLRWSFLVPALAEAWTIGDASTRADVQRIFEFSNQFLGVALGELLGQWLLVIWTAGVCSFLWHKGSSARVLALMGALTLPLWLVGHSELLNTVLPDFPLWETTPAAFILWQLWLLTLIPWLWLTSTATAPIPEPMP